MRKPLLLISLALSIGVISGCAVGVKHDYASSRPQLEVSKAAKLTVGTQDRRPYILNGDKNPNFVGLSRGGYGNPFNIATESGAPLADDFSRTIVTALKTKGIQAEFVILAPKSERKDVEQALTKDGNSKGVLITLNKWQTDIHQRTLLIYDAMVEVLDRNGTVLAKNSIQGADNLGGGFTFNPPAHSRQVTPEAYRKKLEKLLNDPNVVKALE